VLSHAPADAHGRAVRWRQLVDVLARAGSLRGSKNAAQALEAIRTDAAEVDEDLRAATARSIASLAVPSELIALFAQDSLKVSAPLLAAAQLEAGEWERVLSSAPMETQRFVRAIHPKLASMDGPALARDANLPAPEVASDPLSIQDAIERIEALRGRRQPARPVASDGEVEASNFEASPIAPIPSAETALFRWECSPAGELDWVEGAPRAALIGRPLVEQGHDNDGGSAEIARAFALRAPFSNALVTLPEPSAVAGTWQVSGMPAFDPPTGRFVGYRGVAKRADAPAGGAIASVSDPNSLRELVHEIKTPLNAIMGFAQIIQAQMFGPASTSYQSRATEIVAQSHLLLAAIDDLDLAARLQAGSLEDDASRTELASLLAAVVASLKESTEGSGVVLRLVAEPQLPPCEVTSVVAERLVHRLIQALIDCAEPGEQLRVTASQWNDNCTVAVDRPALLKAFSEADLLNPSVGIGRKRNGRLSLGFSLRLVRGSAQLAGGDLIIGKRQLTLVLSRGDLRPPGSDRYRAQAGRGL